MYARTHKKKQSFLLSHGLVLGCTIILNVKCTGRLPRQSLAHPHIGIPEAAQRPLGNPHSQWQKICCQGNIVRNFRSEECKIEATALRGTQQYKGDFWLFCFWWGSAPSPAHRQKYAAMACRLHHWKLFFWERGDRKILSFVGGQDRAENSC